MSFSSLGLSEELQQAVREQQYYRPSPVQAQAIPVILDGRDLLAIAKPGSGQTASFSLPVLQKLQASGATGQGATRALILVPTKEMASKVGHAIQNFCNRLNTINTKMVFGGVSIKLQMKGLQSADILVATPDRLLELVNEEAVNLSHVEIVVLNETDAMMEADCREGLDSILALLPEQRQSLLFATAFTQAVGELADSFLTRPEKIELRDKDNELLQIRQQAYIVEEADKASLLDRLIKSGDWKQVLVFTSFKKRADTIAMNLNLSGIKAEAVYGDKSRRVIDAAVSDFISGELTVLVATDVIARSIDIYDLPYVVNYEPPRSAASYLRRIGKAARMQHKGLAISLVCPDDVSHFEMIEQATGKKADRIDADDPAQA